MTDAGWVNGAKKLRLSQTRAEIKGGALLLSVVFPQRHSWVNVFCVLESSHLENITETFILFCTLGV